MRAPTRLSSPVRRLPLLAALTLLPLLALALGTPEGPPAAAQVPAQVPAELPAQQPDDDLLAYAQIDQWPERGEAAAGLFQSPFDLEVAADGTVLVADRGIGGVHRLLPSGIFTTPFGTAGGFPAQLGQVGPVAIGPPTVAGGADRVYVLDSAVDRVVIYDLLGGFLEHWEGITAQSLAASGDGRVYVLDRESSEVLALDAATGAERFRFGARGTGPGQFSNFTDVDVSEDGRVLVVADLRGARVQLWDLATDEDIAGGAAPAALRDAHDMMDSRFNKDDMVCRANRVNALGGDRLFLGEGEQACLVEGREVTAAIASTANKGTICRGTVRLPRLRPTGAQYFALATYDPNAGACGSKLTELDTTTVVARYNDESLRAVRTVWEAADTDAVEGRLFAPQQLTMPAPDRVFVRDNSPFLRVYATDGQELHSMARDSSGRDQGTEFEVTRIRGSVGSDTLGEVYSEYVKIRRQADQVDFETGIGRFRAAEERTRQGNEAIIEPVWTEAYASGGRGNVGGAETKTVEQLAYNPVSDELLVLQTVVVEAQRTYDVQIARFSADGRELDPPFDAVDDGALNPYSDMSVGPDGRIYLLDDIYNRVYVLGPDGQEQLVLPVSQDAKAVAGGPAEEAGSVFVIREHGTILRYADDGRVTARLDGRAVRFSDPTFITDMVVDAEGRVYVADGQASLVSVFAVSEDADALPVPEDGACDFRARKTASPGVVDLGDPVTVELELLATCGVNEDPTDIVVVVPYLGTLQRGRDTSRQVINNLLSLAKRVNFQQHRVALVSYYQTTTVELELTDDSQAYLDAVIDITRLDAPNDAIKPRLKDAMEVAQERFEPDSGRRQVMVLLNAAYCDPNNTRRPVDCTGFPNAEETAAEIREAGTRILAVFGPVAANLASSDEDVVNSFDDAHKRMVSYRLPDVFASDLQLVDVVPDNMRVDPASISGGGAWAEPEVRWERDSLGYEPWTERFVLAPQEGGTWPTNVEAYVDLVDGWGQAQRIAFPVPEIEVIAPTPVPSATGAPTATPVPSPTPAPSEPGTVYLPFAANRHCWPKTRPLDVALAIDRSSSMEGEKLDAAVEAVRAFLDAARLEPGGDRAALVGFAEEAELLQPLTDDAAALDAALGDLQVSAGTRIDRGLRAALDALAPATDRASQRVIVLLSDGQQPEALEEARAAGEAARAAGVETFTIGLGPDVDAELLRELAQDEAHYLAAPSGEDLAAVYAEIAARLSGCP